MNIFKNSYTHQGVVYFFSAMTATLQRKYLVFIVDMYSSSSLDLYKVSKAKKITRNFGHFIE